MCTKIHNLTVSIILAKYLKRKFFLIVYLIVLFKVTINM